MLVDRLYGAKQGSSLPQRGYRHFPLQYISNGWASPAYASFYRLVLSRQPTLATARLNDMALYLVYLGGTMNSSGSSDIDVSRRMGLACVAVHRISKSQVTLYQNIIMY